MKALYVVLGILLLVVLFGGCSIKNRYNDMNTQSKLVDQKWADVQSSYQRRADLIPNLVATVKGAADFEKSTYVGVAEARAGDLKALTNVNADQLTPDRVAQIQKAANESQNAARMAIHVAIEAYPQLKANQNFLSLQDQLEGTENRIKTARDAYNEQVLSYNVTVTNFPGNIVAGWFHFKERVMFKADEGAEKAPAVKF